MNDTEINETKQMSALDEAAHIHKAYVTLPTEILADAARGRIRPLDVTLYGFLLFWQGSKKNLWFGEAAMARETGLSRATIGRSLRRLEKAGHIHRKKRMNASWITVCITLKYDGILFIRGRGKKRAVAPAAAGHPETKLYSKMTEPVQANSRPTVDQTETDEEKKWRQKQTWSESTDRIYEKIRAHHLFPEAKELFLERIASDKEFFRKLYAEFDKPKQAHDEPNGKSLSNGSDETEQEKRRAIEARDAWKQTIEWTEQDRRDLTYWVKERGELKGKFEFLNEKKLESAEWANLFCTEYPDHENAKWLLADCGALREYRRSKGLPVDKSPREDSLAEQPNASASKPAKSFWGEKVDWNEQLQDRYTRYVEKHGADYAKELFLKELAAEHPEMAELYKREFPDGVGSKPNESDSEKEEREPLF